MNRPSWWKAVLLLGASLGVPTQGAAQVDPVPPEHPLHELVSLVGSWEGTIDGTIGPGTARRQYRFILHDRFLFMTHDRDPVQAASRDDAHEEWTIFSVDAQRDVIVLREFLMEGFVNTYTCELTAGPERLTCAGHAAEGGAGFLLRLRYEFVDRDHFTERFEVFGSDGTMQIRMEGQWVRTSEP